MDDNGIELVRRIFKPYRQLLKSFDAFAEFFRTVVYAFFCTIYASSKNS